MGMHSAVSAFERDGRAVTIADLTPGSIFDIDLSGKIVVDSGIVFKIFGVVQVWFKPNPNSEDDFKGAVLALPLGAVSKVNGMLSNGTKIPPARRSPTSRPCSEALR